MMNLGNVVKDSTIRIPFNSFDAAGASVTVSDFAVADDIKVYKDGSITDRGNTGGYTVTTDLDGNGIHAVNIDLSNTAVTDYYEAGSTYEVAVNAVTIDGETVRFWAGRFVIQSSSVVNNSGSIHFSDPKRLPKSSATVAEFFTGVRDNGSGKVNSTNSAFWTDQIGPHGADIDTDYAVDTYKTLVNLTDGSGVLTGVIGPTAGGSETTTFEITVDGVLTEIAVSVTSGYRAYLGYGASSTTEALAPANSALKFNALNSSKDTFDLFSVTVPDIMGMLVSGTPLLEYTSSLLVRVKHSAAVTGTSLQERRSGAVYYDGFK